MASTSPLAVGSSTCFAVSSVPSSSAHNSRSLSSSARSPFVNGGTVASRIGSELKLKCAGSRTGPVRVRATATAQTSKELERYSAKEDLILSIKDAGGLKGLTDRKADSSGRIDVNEKILAVERMNPTPRPTTSPLLEGVWEFQYAGARSPGLVAAKILLKNFPSALASLTSLTLSIIDGENAKATGSFKVLNSVEGSFTLTSKLAVEGPSKLKEEYVEGVFSSPSVPEGTVPSQLKGVFEQIATSVERLPSQVKDVISGGVKLPLTNTFSRELIISYLDEGLLVVRDKSGTPDVLVRIEAPATDIPGTRSEIQS